MRRCVDLSGPVGLYESPARTSPSSCVLGCGRLTRFMPLGGTEMRLITARRGELNAGFAGAALLWSEYPWAHATAACWAITGPFRAGRGEKPGMPSHTPRGGSPSIGTGVGCCVSVGRLGHRRGVAADTQGCSVSSGGVFAIILFCKSSLGL